MGLYRAGFDVTGVDIKPQPRYPAFHDAEYAQHFRFHQADALTFPLEGFSFIWASPPCQHYTAMLNHGLTDREKYPDLIAKIRNRLKESGVIWVIENVVGACGKLLQPFLLCGEMFGLRVQRHRLFEPSFPLLVPEHLPHRGKGNRKQGDGGYYLRCYGHETGKREWGPAMGIDWMKTPEIAQAIPPAYSEYIGRQAMQVLEVSQ